MTHTFLGRIFNFQILNYISKNQIYKFVYLMINLLQKEYSLSQQFDAYLYPIN